MNDRFINLYFEASILQVKPHAGCQVYAFNILNEMVKLSDKHRFHLHLAMGEATDEVEQLSKFVEEGQRQAKRFTWKRGAENLLDLPLRLAAA